MDNPSRDDHDLLINLAAEIRIGFRQIDTERIAAAAAVTIQNQEIGLIKTDVQNLRLSRATAIGYAMGSSAIIGALIKVFWH